MDPQDAALDLSTEAATGPRILVVCTGNLCRSPMAEAILRRRFEQAGLAVSVESAGTAARAGASPVPLVAELLTARGLLPAVRPPRPVEPEDLLHADLVLVMEEEQRRTLYHRLPAVLPRVLLLGELDGSGEEIVDPHRRGREAHEAALAHIEETIDRGWARLLSRLGLAPRASG